MHHLVGELLLDDHVSSGESFVDIALGELNVSSDVALLVGPLAQIGGRQVFLDQRCVVGHGGADVHHRRQNFKVNLDQV